MNRTEKILVVGIILMLVFSISGGQGATAKPQEATTIKYISVPAGAFIPFTPSMYWENYGNVLSTDSGGGSFTAWVKLPNGARVRNITLFAKDTNGTYDVCVSIYHNKPASGSGTKLGEACSTGTTTGVEKFKTAFPKVKVTGSQNLVLALTFTDKFLWVNSVRVGYFK